MSVLKNVTGGDYVKVGDNMTKALTSMMIVTNSLPDHKIQPEFSSDALMRRIICVEMKVDTSALDSVEDPNGDIPRLNLLCNLIVVRLMYQHVPIRPMDVLLTLCGTKYHQVREFITELSDGIITEGEGRAVMCYLAALLDCSTGAVSSRCCHISQSCVEETFSGVVIKGLKLIS
jgi:hypothetical protein